MRKSTKYRALVMARKIAMTYDRPTTDAWSADRATSLGYPRVLAAVNLESAGFEAAYRAAERFAKTDPGLLLEPITSYLLGIYEN